MTSLLALTDAVAALLRAPPALAGGFIQRGRALHLPQGQSQGIFISLVRATGDMPFAGDSRTDWRADIAIGMACRAIPGGDGTAAVDALLEAVYGRLAADQTPWLLNPSLVWDAEEADQTVGFAELQIRIDQRTASGSLAAAT